MATVVPLIPADLIPIDLIYNIYGAHLMGTLVATFLSGMNTLQTVVYFRVYNEDTMKLKALVATIWGLDIIHTVFLWSSAWIYLINNFGQVDSIDVITKPELVPGIIIVTSIVVFIVHMFYVQRIFLFSHRNYWITTAVFILVLVDAASGLGAIVILDKYQHFLDFINSGYTWIFSVGFICTAMSDIVIMIILLVLLLSSRQRSISLNNAINQLVLYTLETGSLTALMAIATMIAWLTEEHTDIYLGIYMSGTKVYANTLLGLLNTRYQLRHGSGSKVYQGHNTIRVANPVMHPSNSANLPMLYTRTPKASTEIQRQHIDIDTARSVWVDDE